MKQADAALKPLVLGESIVGQTVMAKRDAKLCAPAVGLRLTPEKALYKERKSTPSFQLWIENPSAAAVKVCLLRFSVVASPLVLVELLDSKKEKLGPRMPEVYPVEQEEVGWETFTIPPQARVLVRQPFMMDPGPIPAGSTASWAVWLNGDYKSGESPVAKR